MPKFQLHDTVVLRREPAFVGLIERTSHFESEPLDDCLIIAHTHVPENILDQFVKSGTPPSGYVFVQFASQEKGSSLIAEEDLALIDRMFELGDVVKQDQTKTTGTVINVSNVYALDPVWQPALSSNDFNAVPTDRSSPSMSSAACDQSCNHLNPQIRHAHPHRLIANVPFEELKRVQDFIEGDYIIEQDWLGVVDDIELLVVVRLTNNTIVAVADPEELFIPIPDYGRPLVSLLEFDGIPRPHYVSAMQGWGNTIPPQDLECGQFVVTNQRNIRDGRWLRGSYDPQVKPEGHVLMVRCRHLSVQWLMCNAFTPEMHWKIKRPDYATPYENINTFPHPAELRRNRAVHQYDPGKPATLQENRTRDAVANDAQQPRKAPLLNLSSNFNVGDQVKFRDPAGAAVKYQGQIIHGIEHGKFHRIFHTDTLGYDLNEFEIVQSRQTATVRWQDGTISEHTSTTLTKMHLFEADFMPADIVVAREGMKQRPYDELQPSIRYPPVDFNEMTYFEKPHELLPAKVGVIQSVNASDKIAQVRWFANPRIRITRYGYALGPESRFGTISDKIEDVSLYEVMTFPALIRKIRDIVTIPPSTPSSYSIKLLESIPEDDVIEVGAAITSLSQIDDRSPGALLEWMQHNAKLSMDGRPKTTMDTEQYKAHRSIDWVGEICQLRTDGTLLVRLNTSRDLALHALIEHDQILSFVDEHPAWMFDYSEDPMEVDSDSMSQASDFSHQSHEILSEIVEYEGGRRIDDDAGDENWESEDELQDYQIKPRSDSVAMVDMPSLKVTSDVVVTPSEESSQSEAALNVQVMQCKLASFLPDTEPPAFLSLDKDPPADQFRAEQPPQTSSAFLKRIAKEHRILSSSLPSHEIYVRTYDSRLDLLRCLIIGPLDTPYENAPFLIDLHLGRNFPLEPPTAHFHSWTSGLGRINPNLYEEGKICLSLLGTWPGKSETEAWSEKATILQLLVSLQGLVFVKEPFYNEAGFEGYETTKEYTNESLLYSEKAYVMARNFVKHALTNPVASLEDVLAWIYLPRGMLGSQLGAPQEAETGLLNRVIKRSKALMQRSEEVKAPSQQLGGEDADGSLLSGDGKSDDDTKVFLKPLSKGAFVMLSKTLKTLDGIWIEGILAITAKAAASNKKPAPAQDN